MTVDVRIPSFGESITEVMIGEWYKQVGESVKAEEPLCSVESEKSTLDVPAPVSGILVKIFKQAGEQAQVGDVIAQLTPVGVEQPPASSALSGSDSSSASRSIDSTPPAAEPRVMPAAARLLQEHQLSPQQVQPTGPGGRLLKEDVLRTVADTAGTSLSAATPPRPSETPLRDPSRETVLTVRMDADRSIRRKPMSQIRRTIARNLVEAQHNAALLTTFNECDMSAVMALRKQHQEAFTERHGVKLGIMSFFVKAAVDALQAFPAINAQIDGNDIVYFDYCDIGIAIGGGKGLVVPVLRNAELMTFAQIEQKIADFAKRAQSGQLLPEELRGGTFTISNGGVYGSLLSTPIVNPPQSGVLGMHAIQDRPVVRDGQIVIRPMMYLALTYDHRIVDGREAVSFLKRIKDCIENPVRLMLEA
ncbi:MAG: dihydrolipoyllysine-residue succinyltransferase component of 2-oxoglutarate dehydrogenase complex [Planctomycetaceae bacterium]|nr:MAG: dihydrolipoyllysine-residue succinyltransferase component of 2-oxoglutarate dehydrogenase complex [Planctomycetaceae bacterium]